MPRDIIKLIIYTCTFSEIWYFGRYRPVHCYRTSVSSILVWDAFSSSLVSWFHPPETGLKNRLKDSLLCSPPRKSLVKGERFMRCEGKPECSKTQRGKPGQTKCITNVVLANFQSQMTFGCMRDTSALCTTRKMCWVICQILVESTLPLM